ncbi:MAG: AAA family ATPase [Floccifex sp.]
MKFGKRNQVNLDILSYNIMLLGESGVGKTTLINDVCTKYTGSPDSVLFLEIGQERGADAIDDINYVNCPEWNMDYDELTNSAGFYDVCEDIITNKVEKYPELKVVAIDTYDQLITLAEQEAINLWNRECRTTGNPEKCCKTINQAWSGFGRGEKKAIELMLDTFAELRRVGVSTIIIGHVKNKQLEDALTGQTYQVLTSDQQQNYFSAIKKNLHFLGLAYVDRKIAAEKTGRKNAVTKKDEMVNRIQSETRKIRFRDDGAVVDCKSRFANIVPEIDLDADQFIKALEDAIRAEQSKSGKSYEEAKAEQDKINKEKEKRIIEAEKEKHTQKELESIKDEIVNFFTENKTEIDVIKPVLEEMRSLGYENPNEISSLKDAKAILKMTK